MIPGIDVGGKKLTQGVLLDGDQFIILKDKGYNDFDVLFHFLIYSYHFYK